MNNHGGQAAEGEFWGRHAKPGTHGHGHGEVPQGGHGGAHGHEETRHEIKEHAKEAHGHDGKARGDALGTIM